VLSIDNFGVVIEK